MSRISVLENFTEYPGLRNCSISDHSGEEFYHTVLNLAFKNAFEANEKLIVDLDGTGGYASSFLDEAFGNLVYDFSLDIVKARIVIISKQIPDWNDVIINKTFVQWEIRRKKQEAPKVTENHPAWYRLINNKLEQKIWELPVV